MWSQICKCLIRRGGSVAISCFYFFIREGVQVRLKL